jgi:hypothetical protein
MLDNRRRTTIGSFNGAASEKSFVASSGLYDIANRPSWQGPELVGVLPTVSTKERTDYSQYLPFTESRWHTHKYRPPALEAAFFLNTKDH